jgi:hypothetical protein
MNKNKHFWLVTSILLVFLLAVGVRTYAAFNLHVDHDETTYLIVSNKYANHMRNGDFNWLAWEKANFEHPPLTKILNGVVLLSQAPLDVVKQTDLIDEKPILEQQAVEYALAARMVSVIFGSLAVLFLAFINPLAGFFLAINSLAVKYTSEIYLEALPMMFSLIAVLAYLRFFSLARGESSISKSAWAWLALSSIALGVTAASKYTYVIAGFAIALHWVLFVIFRKMPVKSLLLLVAWGLVSIFVFFMLDPYLWVHTFERLQESMTYHLRFSQSKHVSGAMYPIWQPLNWLFRPFAHYTTIHDPYHNNALFFRLDTLISVFAVLGLWRTLKRQPVFIIWLLIGLGLLFYWDTKWAQYTLILLAPWCFAASRGVLMVYDFARSLINKPGRKTT